MRNPLKIHTTRTEISSLFDPSDKYYAYFDPDSAVSGLDALRLLDEYISAEGPFDSVLAFSQGACLAAMHIIRKAHHQHEAGLHRTAQALPFKCAIFLSGGAPRDPSAYEHRGELRILDPARDGRLIAIPTVHIWGDQDEWKSNSKLMKDMCREENATSFVHEGEHEVPGLGVKGAIIGTVNAMRRGIYRAEASM